MRHPMNPSFSSFLVNDVFGDPGRTEVLRAAGLEYADVLALTASELPVSW